MKSKISPSLINTHVLLNNGITALIAEIRKVGQEFYITAFNSDNEVLRKGSKLDVKHASPFKITIVADENLKPTRGSKSVRIVKILEGNKVGFPEIVKE